MTGRRLDDFSRRAAGPQADRGTTIDALSRALALGEPVSRRRALGVLGGALVAGRLVWTVPALAQGASCPKLGDPAATKACTRMNNGGVQLVCVRPEQACCNSDRCAGACTQSWQVCAREGSATASCDDSAAMCSQPGSTATTFCSKTVTFTPATNVCGVTRDKVIGWCCPPGAECGNDFNDCECAGETCGYLCCPEHYVCGHDPDGKPTCVRPCPDGRDTCGLFGECCGLSQTCGGILFRSCECNHGFVRCGSGCCQAATTPADPNLVPGTSWSDAGRAAAAADGGNRRAVRAGPVVAGVGGAVRALAAVAAQRGATLAAFTDGHRDQGFSRIASPARTSLPAVQAAAGLDAASAKALTALLAAEARASAQIAAAATALARSRAAGAARHRSAARRQLLASARYAGQAATTLGQVAKLRSGAAAALRAGHVAEVVVTGEQIVAFQRRVRSSGVPADLAALLARLGIRGRDLARVRTGLLGDRIAPISLGGPALVAPLTSAGEKTALQTLIRELKRYASAARRHPIARSH